MFIDHAAVYVEDLERGARFYEQYFGGVRGERYENPRTGFSSYFITFDGGNTRLEVMHNDAIGAPGGPRCAWICARRVQRRLARARG